MWMGIPAPIAVAAQVAVAAAGLTPLVVLALSPRLLQMTLLILA
jgi:hypothetical protein